MKVVIESNCVCEPDEENPESLNCFGDCWEWQKEDVEWIIGEWQTKNNVDDEQPILITGTNMNWNHVSGYAEATPKTILDKLTLNGDFSLEFDFEPEENTFNVVRRSHDEMGALFEFVIMEPCDKCGVGIPRDIYNEELGMCVSCSNEYFDSEDDE